MGKAHIGGARDFGLFSVNNGEPRAGLAEDWEHFMAFRPKRSLADQGGGQNMCCRQRHGTHGAVRREDDRIRLADLRWPGGDSWSK